MSTPEYQPGVVHTSVCDTDQLAEERRLRLAAEAQLAELIERNRDVLDAVGMGFWSIDLATEDLEWDERFRTLHGIPADAPASFAILRAAIHPADLDRIVQARLHAAEGVPVDLDHRVLWRDGSEHWIRTRGRLKRDALGRPQRLVGVALDIDALKRAEVERAKLEAQFQDTQRMEALGQLTGGIAHDFNNLLLAIRLSLEAIDEIAGDTDAAPLAGNAIAAVDRASALTQQLLAFGRRQSLKPARLDLAMLIGEVSAILERSLEANILIKTEIAKNLWPVFVDPGQLQGAILNLALNARDALPKGGMLRIEAANAGADRVRISVSDAGLGMSEDVMRRAFEPFFTTKHEAGHSGLGLSQVYGFIRQSGGTVDLTSAPGAGTTITIHLPRAADEVTRPTPGDLHAPRGDEMVLVVEDNEMVRRIVARLLRDLGYRVALAATAEEALKSIEEGAAADLLFTDVVLPGAMNGFELASRVAALRPGLAILVTSGYPERVGSEAPEIAQRWPLLSKPYTKLELAAALRGALAMAAP